MSSALDRQMRRFKLLRIEDVSGISGTGYVAEGCVFSTGSVALTWYGKFTSYYWYPDVATLEGLHGHQGRTRVEWIDPPPIAPTAGGT